MQGSSQVFQDVGWIKKYRYKNINGKQLVIVKA
jgi:hypothetical protein